MNWHLITGEYPPQPGGVSDYTEVVAQALADAGQTVTVWCPPAERVTPGGKVRVRRELGAIGSRDLRRVDELLNAEAGPRKLLVQWVPHAFGRRAMNLAFCRWIRRRARRGDRVEIMVHEAFLDFAGSWKQRVAGVVQRWMMRSLLRSAAKAWVTIPAWEQRVRPFAPAGLPITWLPVPSTVPVRDGPAEVAAVRQRFLGEASCLIGHFGTYGAHVEFPLRALLGDLLEAIPNANVLLLGREGERFRETFVGEHPANANRLIAPGQQRVEELSPHIAACDLFVQPYRSGISSRNTSLMACLAHGRPVVATAGRLTEPFWAESGALALAAEDDVKTFCGKAAELLCDVAGRERMAAAASKLYETRFSVAQLVSELMK